MTDRTDHTQNTAERKKVTFYTLGCKLNFSESSTIARQFEQKGYKKVEFTETPDIFVINTCSVTDNADKKCRKVVREALKISPHGFIIIIGCYAQLKPKEISEIEGVDAVLGAAEKFRLLEVLDDFRPRIDAKTNKKQSTVFSGEIREVKAFNNAYSMNDRTRTFLKVQDGCNYQCTFCTIPLARGKSRSDTIANVMVSANEIAATDVKEVVITGVNTGDFGIHEGKRTERFVDLVKELDTVEGIDRYRISSIEPNLITEEIVDICAASKRFVPHFHIPLQSGNDKILKMMRRRYERDLYADRVRMIKEKMPDACIGVDVIVGFPGETEQDFLDTYEFINGLDVGYLHVFSYSERANTPAADMEGVVPNAERQRRSKMLRILSEKKKHKFYEENIGKTARVLFENDVEDGMMHGFTENYVRVRAKYDPMLINEVKEVKMTGLSDNGMMECEEIPVVYEKH
ncbi:tRNA (N(6)-L-threonylcarbamoyladenosine(37)-C(2))-methylthiotransferase MtaB [Fulvitalea axinellae]|uniref:Threonylcarbamoyladenosine tRNA methylthiotransferase MtaB n=1 Tax=Fulvitalea axinellae TaxID=1182444 RepID=A0AAU9CPJ7_9BACT|nr:tRNA (N(6)-L-threonylcarbamoyladenosine(37)-C(2))-methylthiotransferase MtaB [Fulvitalea axinellae]